jgi:8-oxo-dGTP pyrophosphatase MutT (NUDIX family)
MRPSLAVLLDRYQPQGEAEAADLRRVRALAGTVGDPWRRELPLHVTASALIVHPPTGRVLLRWHQRQQAWLQVGGHGDPGESDPLAIVGREAAEETGLADLVPWPDERLRHLVIVGVPPGKGEPAHEHADLRYFMATQTPDAARAENADAPLRWLSLPEARAVTSEANLLETMARLGCLLRRLPNGSVALPRGSAAQQRGGWLSGQRTGTVRQLHHDRILVHSGPYQAVVQRHLHAGVGAVDQELGRAAADPVAGAHGGVPGQVGRDQQHGDLLRPVAARRP